MLKKFCQTERFVLCCKGRVALQTIWKLFTLGTKICQRICFLMRPLIWVFFNDFKIGKKHQRRRCAWVGLTNFSKSRKTRGVRRQSCQQLKRMTPNIDGKVTNVKREREISSFILTFSLRAVRSYSMDRRYFPFLITAIKCQEVSSIPSFRRRDWTQFHRSNFPCVIDTCIFTCWNATVYAQFYFYFRSDAICFPADFSSQNKNWSVMRPGP